MKRQHKLHKLHRISNRTLVIIEEELVQALKLDEDESWVEEIPTNEGILLRLQRKS